MKKFFVFIIFIGTTWAAKIEYPQKFDNTKRVTRIINGSSIPLNKNDLSNIIPDPPNNLRVTNIGTNSATIYWKLPYGRQYKKKLLMYSISYTSEYSNGTWTELKHINDQTAELKNLEYAYARYIIRVKTKFRASIDKAEMWSNYVTYNFTTRSRIPDDPPATCVGCFFLSKNKTIELVWKELPLSRFNGPNPRYNVYVKNGSDDIFLWKTTNEIAIDRSNIVKNNLNDMEFRIYTSNDVGESNNYSVIRVPKKLARNPRNVKRSLEYMNETHSFHHAVWNNPDDMKDIVSYTVCWYSFRLLPNFEATFSFEHVDKSVNNWKMVELYYPTITVIGIVSNTLTTSSTIEWATEELFDSTIFN